VSEELRQRGYIGSDGTLHGDPAEEFELFNLGATTVGQLALAGVVPKRDYGDKAKLRPDALFVSRNGMGPIVRLVVEFKNARVLNSESTLKATVQKVARDYCCPLGCRLAVLSDGTTVRWIAVDTKTSTGQIIEREDGYPLDTPIDLDPDGNGPTEAGRMISRIQRELNPSTGRLEPPEAVDPTRLADQTWQTIWLASGENPERCLSFFIEVLLFKFLSDLGTLSKDRDGCPTTFDHVVGLSPTESLRYYSKLVRPEITRLFPAGPDDTGVVGELVLDPGNADHGRLFWEILANFRKAGPLKRIDPEFKSRIFERFLKKSVSRQNWGQYLTPRNVVKAIVEMSGVEHLAPGAAVADPFCGVGGFVLEPLVHKRPHDFRHDDGWALAYRGFDRDPKTIVLAKANMLIHLSEVLEGDPEHAPARLALVLNATFTAVGDSISGSLSRAPREAWDLVMTNPPYVVAGMRALRRMLAEDPALASYYSIPGLGVENLCLQEIVAGLRPGGQAFVIVPDGLLIRHSEEALKRHLLRHCFLEAVVSLPRNTFYSTPKKTYVLVFRKKPPPDERQEHDVLTYLVGEVGETRDARRFPIEENDLPSLVSAFKRFRSDAAAYSGEDPAERLVDQRAKIVPVGTFRPEEHWLVDRWWPEAERQALGDLDQAEVISPRLMATRLREDSEALQELADLIDETSDLDSPSAFATVSLSDPRLFRLSIGKRVLKRELFDKGDGPIPLYSANVGEPFGHVHSSNITDFSHPSVLWGIDGNFQVAAKEAGVEFATTDHCGRIEIVDDRLDAGYCREAIALVRRHNFDRTLRPSLRRIKALEFEVPVGPDGKFDLASQKALASAYDLASQAKELAPRGR